MLDVNGLENAPLGYLLYRVHSALRGEMATVLSPLNMTFTEFVCMRMLSVFGEASNAQLSRRAGVTPQAMNTVLRELESRGVVSRPTAAPSGRALPASLTADGRKLLKRAESVVHLADDRILAPLDDGERATFTGLLLRLAANQSMPD